MREKRDIFWGGRRGFKIDDDDDDKEEGKECAEKSKVFIKSNSSYQEVSFHGEFFLSNTDFHSLKSNFLMVGLKSFFLSLFF